MDNLLSWIVRGLNGLLKQKEINNFLLCNKVGLGCLLETKIKSVNFPKVYQVVCNGWCCTTNFSSSYGGRIMVVWLASHFYVEVKRVHSQFIHARVTHLGLKRNFACTFVMPLIRQQKGRTYGLI